MVIIWSKVRVIIWSKLGVQKSANLDQIITIAIARSDCYSKQNLLKPYFYSVFDKQCLKKTNLDQIIAIKNPKLGPDKKLHSVYIYIYMFPYIICQPRPNQPTFFASCDLIIAILWHVGLVSKHSIRAWAGSRNPSAGG